MTPAVATSAVRAHYAARLAAVHEQLDQARRAGRAREEQALRIAEQVLLAILIEIDEHDGGGSPAVDAGVPEQPHRA